MHFRSLIALPALWSGWTSQFLAGIRHDTGAQATIDPVCILISVAISSDSNVYYEGSSNYDDDIFHWASSSSQRPKCCVEPGNAADVATILKIVGTTRTPFAVQGGGHSTNPGFSSTTGVHIAMRRFSNVTYDSLSQTATIGAGLIWDEVYDALEPHGVSVVGGRVTGVGVAGLTLGGGYSWKTNQYGLTVDTVTAFGLVLPNGTYVTVTELSDPILFFAMKGGFNNFGIVIEFTLKTFPQTTVWGGLITYTGDHMQAISSAVANFSANVKDPKAAIITAYNYLFFAPGISHIMFYDGPNPPAGIFDEFLAIPHFTKDVSTRSYTSLVQSSVANVTKGFRGIFNSVSLLEYTPAILKVVENETTFWGRELDVLFVSYDVEPFLPTYLTHSDAPSAYPPARTQALLPLNIFYSYLDSSYDDIVREAARQSAAHIRAQVIAQGQDVADVVYGNYAIFDTPLQNIYGDRVDLLHWIKESIDSNNVMGLAGGFKF